MRAFDTLSQANGLKTTQSVLDKQQSGVDAQQKANPQPPTFTAEQLDVMDKDISRQNSAVPVDETPEMKAAREKTIATQQAIANGVDVAQGADMNEDDTTSVPVVKKAEAPKQMSYADMFKAIYGNEETEEQKAKREKRERRNARIAAIGDGLRALSNIYFSTKGANVTHNPDSDLSAVMLKRKKMLDEQRDKNKTAWLNGYLKAQSLDEEKRQKETTLEELKRYHDMMADRYNRNADQTDTRLGQGQQRIDLANNKQEETVRHNKATEAIGQQNAQSRAVSAAKSGQSGKGKSGTTKRNYSGNVAEYIDLKEKDPKGMAEAEAVAKNMGWSPKTAAGKAAAREIYRRKHSKTNHNVKPKVASKPSSGKKKLPSVKWN